MLEEVPTALGNGLLGTIHDFTVALGEGEEAAGVLERSAAIEEAIAAVLNGAAEDDAFNRLVVGTALAACEADWLRAFYRYLRQTGLGFTIYTVVDALRRAPQVTRPLVALFAARHDPAFTGDRAGAADEHNGAIRRGLGPGRRDQRRPAAAAVPCDHRGGAADQRVRPCRARGAGA